MYHKINFPTVMRKKLTVKSFSGGLRKGVDESLTDLSRAKISYNFDYSGGTLKRGLGLKSLQGYDVSVIKNLKVLAVYYYKRYDHFLEERVEKIIYYCSNKKLYIANVKDKVFVKLSDVTFSETPVAVQYDYLDNDVMLFACKTGELYYLDDEALHQIDNAPSITSLCMHKERLFVTVAGEGTSLWFSDDFDPTNWVVSLTEAGFIDFADEYGKLQKVMSFLDYVYVFREYGISRVVAYGDQQEFSTDNLFGRTGKIYGSSVTDCGDFIMMLTSSGIYRFNGLDTVKILTEYDEFLSGVDNSNAKGVCSGNLFYLNLNVRVDKEIKIAILIYDLNSKISYLNLGLDVKDFVFTGGDMNEILCVKDGCLLPFVIDNSGAVDGVCLTKSWQSAYTDLGVNCRKKRLSKVSFYTKEDVTLVIESDEKRLIYNVLGGGYREVYPSVLGEKFGFNLTTASNSPEISNLSVIVEYVKGAV